MGRWLIREYSPRYDIFYSLSLKEGLTFTAREEIESGGRYKFFMWEEQRGLW